MIVTKRFTFGPFSENTFLVWDESTKETAVVDPGCFNKEEEDRFSDFITAHELNLKYMIVTHGHIDHVAGCDYVSKKYAPKFYAPEKDMELLLNANLQGKTFGISVTNPSAPDEYLTSETKILLGESKMEFLFTPGHTPGEHCIYFPEEQFCITGDVLFQGSIGRTDLWGGDYDTLMNSIYTQLLTLPDETLIYPGHGDSSKIGIEKKNNQFLNS